MSCFLLLQRTAMCVRSSPAAWVLGFLPCCFFEACCQCCHQNISFLDPLFCFSFPPRCSDLYFSVPISRRCLISLQPLIFQSFFMFLQNYSRPSVMALAVPVAVKFLQRGNKELCRNMSSYLSLAAIAEAELLADHTDAIVKSVLQGMSIGPTHRAGRDLKDHEAPTRPATGRATNLHI